MDMDSPQIPFLSNCHTHPYILKKASKMHGPYHDIDLILIDERQKCNNDFVKVL
jgi:hypothetical protein